MQNELHFMLGKVERLAQAVKDLHQENLALRNQLMSAQSENQSLTSRLAAARERVNSLIDKLPGA
jgi:cell division protein ZapB